MNRLRVPNTVKHHHQAGGRPKRTIAVRWFLAHLVLERVYNNLQNKLQKHVEDRCVFAVRAPRLQASIGAVATGETRKSVVESKAVVAGIYQRYMLRRLGPCMQHVGA